MSAVSAHAYARAHTAVYVSDKLRGLLKLLVRHYGLDPKKVVDAWADWVDHAARTWLESGHLEAVVVEFYKAGSDKALARWDFPIRYDGTDIDEMWVDRMFLEESFAKAKPPPSGCSYRILLLTDPSRPDIPGISKTNFRSTEGLVAREIGTVIATPDIMASGRYYT